MTVGAEQVVRSNRQRKRLAFTTSLPGAVRRSDVVFIAVGTPTGEDGSADLKYVLAAADEIGRAMNGYKVIVDKSTVPAGTAELVEQTIARRTKHPFSVVSNPEFLKEGAAVEDFLKPDRVVIGAKDEQAAELMRELYRPFTRTGAPIMVMDPVSAELSKYAANAMLATRISFMNEFANICEAFGGDIDQVRRAIGADRRIGPAFLFAGCGYGGSCFPKDVRAVIRFSAERNYRFRILEAVERVNEAQKVRLLRRVDQLLGRRLSGRRIAVWGLAFKPRTDDMREAPSIPIIRGLLDRGAKVRAFDPEAMETARAVFGRRIGYAADAYDALRRADALVIVTEWNEFREPDFERMQKMMKTPIVIDGRNIYEPERMRELGFTYASVGRP